VLVDGADATLFPEKTNWTPCTPLPLLGSAHALGAAAVFERPLSDAAFEGSRPGTAAPELLIGVPATILLGQVQTSEKLKK
jgi:hypothetical protein